ncbi:speckle targeted PIP5K1A-regulated poly(A) polymerase [Caerostris darwini]|uniref:Speckle targeted PIP5K1A-regulated poly(A) polymerase n=1 Tax=Caerostris darwini TaxID=1538125 RepID=A0AAV4N8Z6_9ARAC|nr:speckle targeted PIP5K1A-regulated poly(A) polymerase [Caerostris darwini]
MVSRLNCRLRYIAQNSINIKSSNITSTNINKNYFCIDNSEISCIKQAFFSTSAIRLKKPHTTKNWKFYARDGKKPDGTHDPETKSVEEGKDAIRHFELMSKLLNCSSFSEQIETFISEISLTPEDLKKRTAFCHDLEEIFKIYFPDDFKVYQFGSSVNGLGFKGCDLDVCFQINFTDEEYVTLKDVPTLEDVKEGIVPPDTLRRLTPLFMLRFIRRALFKGCPDISKVLFIKARCPLLRFYRPDYDIFCDFSVENKFSVKNTMLLRLLSHFDARFPVLTKIIRYWGKYGDFVGDIEKFNSYSFSLLVVHFLQTRNPPIFPTINELVSKSEYLKRKVVEDDDTMFKDIKKFSPSTNTKTVEELLREFFFHYLIYDFTRIMQPATATSIPISSFDFDEDPTEKFEINTVSIQDPFRPNFNVTREPSFESCIKFQTGTYQACTSYHNNSVTAPSKENWGLPVIFNKSLSESKMSEESRKLQVHSIEISPVSEVDIKLRKILEHALLFYCTPLHISTEESKTLLKLHCVVKHNTWKGRDWVTEMHKSNDNLLDLEHLISKELIQRSENMQAICEFTCECKEQDASKITVVLNFKKPKIITLLLATFLKEYIPCIIKKL